MNPITTILADDASLVRSAIARLLALHPDVAVLDVDMPGMDGIEVAEQQPGTRVLIPSSVTASGTYHAAMRAGACGHLSKTAPSSSIGCS
jgi:two-component system response regulator DesR